MRYIIGAVCLAVVILRATLPNLKFDNVSLVLFVLGVIILLFPEIHDLIRRIKRVKIGSFEMELGEKLKELAARTDNVEEKASNSPLKSHISPERDDEVIKRFINVSSDPRATLLLVAIEIEKSLRNLAEQAQVPEAKRFYSTTKLMNFLADKRMINPDVVPIFKDFWSIRNQVVHDHHFDLSSGKLYELTELGLRILRLLTIEGNLQSSGEY